MLLSTVFREICSAQNWRFKYLLGYRDCIPEGADVALYGHSLVNLAKFGSPFRGVHIIRDPRDIIVSGYLYHKRTKEDWCTNENFSLERPVVFPRVPYSQEYRDEKWKEEYLVSLNCMSYKNHLRSLSRDRGIEFEMNNYGSWTINSMADWDPEYPNILEVKFEELMTGFDATFEKIFQHLGFSSAEVIDALSIASKHDLSRKTSAEIASMGHVSAPKTGKWVEYFNAGHKRLFVEKFGDVLVKLGYERNNDWARF